MPTTPVSELIARDVLTTVASVTTGHGYNYTLSASRHSRAGDKRQHLNAVIVQHDPREVSEPKIYNTKEWWLPFAIGIYIMPDETDTTPIDQYVNVIRADVENALMADRYRSNNALDTQVRAPTIDVIEGIADLLIVNVEVNYRTSELDSYVNAR